MKYTRTRNLPAILTSKKDDDELERYLSKVRALYTSISMHTSDSMIIDSSKLPTYGLTLLLIPEIEVSVVHLIRDPRGVAYSWQKKKLAVEQSGFMPQINPATSSLLWVFYNAISESFLRPRAYQYIKIRYEDFVRNPKGTVARILSMMNLNSKTSDALFVEEKVVRVAPQHSMSGNPSRFCTGNVMLTLDNDWKSEMLFHHKAAVTAITWPYLAKYRYSLL